jgi:hypothetical protein
LTDVNDSASITSASGLIAARGGQAGGHGGQIETSGYLLRVDGLVVDASAATSYGGEWLLDPYNITITSSTGNNTIARIVYYNTADRYFILLESLLSFLQCQLHKLIFEIIFFHDSLRLVPVLLDLDV